MLPSDFLNTNISGITSDTNLIQIKEKMYNIAWDFFYSQNYAESEKSFRILCQLECNNKSYLMGLAATYQIQKYYLRAAYVYTTAQIVSYKDFHPLLCAGYCFLSGNDVASARDRFIRVIDFCLQPEIKLSAEHYLSVMNKS